MINVSDRFPVRTGNAESDLEKLYDYLYQLERELRYELQKPEKMFALSEGAEVRRSADGVWIGDRAGENGINIKFGTGATLVVDGAEREL